MPGSWNRQERGSDKPDPLKCGSIVPRTNPRRYCTLNRGWGTEHPGQGRCRYHGGASLGGRDHPNYIDGRDSKYRRFLPARLHEIFDIERTDAQLMGLGDEIRIAEALHGEALQKLATGETGDTWRRTLDAIGEMEQAIQQNDPAKASRAMVVIRDAAQTGTREHAAIQHLVRLQRHLARLKAVELRQWEARHGVLTPREVRLLVHQIGAIVLAEIKDAATLGRVERRIAGLLGADNGSPPPAAQAAGG